MNGNKYILQVDYQLGVIDKKLKFPVLKRNEIAKFMLHLEKIQVSKLPEFYIHDWIPFMPLKKLLDNSSIVKKKRNKTDIRFIVVIFVLFIGNK